MPLHNPRGTNDAALASVWTSALATLVSDINDALSHTTSIFPSSTSLTCTLTAAATANAFNSWTEIVDSASTAFSDSFTTADGHLSSMIVETLSDDNAIYMFEVSCGNANTIVTRERFAGITKFQAPNNQKRFWGPVIPAGEKVYYRMKTATAVADTCTIHFRYHTH